MNEKIEIFSSKQKSLLLLIGSILFVIGGIWMFINAENASFRARNPFFLKTIGILAILFFGIAFCISIKQLIINKLLLVIDKNGININPNKPTSEIITWKNIEDISELKIQNQKLIIIQVINATYWIEKEKNKIRKKLIQFNFNNYGSPFVLSSISMQINHNELVKVLNDNLEKYKHLT